MKHTVFARYSVTALLSAVAFSYAFADGEAPRSAGFSESTATGCPKPITLPVWDTETGSGELDCTIVDAPAHGTLVYRFPGSAPTNSRYVVYTATNGYTGTDTFSFRANDGTLDSNLATGTVVVASNTAPVARTSRAFAVDGCEEYIRLNVSDLHTTTKQLDCSIVDAPSNGTAQLRYPAEQPTNSFQIVYVPTKGFTGSDSFSYTASDGLLNSGTATCIVSVASNTSPTASDSSANATPGITCDIYLNGNDEETNWDWLECYVITDPTNGTLAYRYPDSFPSNSMYMNYTGTNGHRDDSFTFVISDGSITSAAALCSIEAKTNAPPDVNGGSETMAVDDSVLEIELNGWDDYTDYEEMEFIITGQPSNGVVTYKYPGTYPTNSRHVVFTLTNSVVGTGEITYKANDGLLDSALSTCTVSVVSNTAPTGSDRLSYTVLESEPYDISLTCSDAETYYRDLECLIVSQPAHGVVVYRQPESYPTESRYVTYIPDQGYTGSDSFSYMVSDGRLETASLPVSITVEANTAPTASDFSVTTSEQIEETVSLSVSDDHTSTYKLECMIVSFPDHGSLEYEYPDNYPQNSYRLIYTADKGYAGSDQFTYRCSDGSLTSGVATCTITVENNLPPEAFDMTETTVSETPLNITLDVSDDFLSASYIECIVEQPTNGAVTYRYPDNYPDYSRYIAYTPTNGFTGTDSFRFKACDGVLTSSWATCTVEVQTNHPPVAYDIRKVTSPDTEATLYADYSEEDSGQSISASLVSNAVNGNVQVNGTSFDYTPDTGFTGIDHFAYKVNDGFDDSNIATARVQVRDPAERGSNLVILAVNETLHPNISNEVARLKNDLVNEGYTSRIAGFPSGTSVATLWNHLHTEYTNANQWLVGAILIGDLPKPSVDGHKTDLVYWNMNELQTEGSVHDYHIWVSRIYAGDTSWGSQIELIKRALDANHAYRTGKSRLGHTAYYYHAWESRGHHGENMLDVWPDVVSTNEIDGDHQSKSQFFPERSDIYEAGADAFVGGSDVFQETSHGNSGSYMNGKFREYDLYRLIAQQRYCMIESCTSGAFGGIVNQHIFTRGGGCVYAVGGTEINYVGDFQVAYPYSSHERFRQRLAAGESFGGALLYEYIFRAENRTVHYGDLSMPVMMSPSNAVPEITDIASDKATVAIGEPVTVSIAVSDPDADASDSPHVGFEHQVEWFMKGYDRGRNEPTAVTNNNSTSWTNITHTYTNEGTYTVRAEVMDEWQARGWKEIAVTAYRVTTSEDAATTGEDTPVTIDVLENDNDPDGNTFNIVAVTQGSNGSVSNSGSDVTYSPDAGFTGNDSFTYTATDGWTSDTGTVSVSVLAAPPDPKLDTGRVTDMSDSWQVVQLARSYDSMVVVATANYTSNQPPAVVRIRNASGNQFEAMVQNPSGTNLSGYTMYYMAMEEGVYSEAEHGAKMEAVKYSSTVTDQDDNWTGELRDYANAYTAPVVLGQVMSANDPGWSVFWSCGDNRESPASSATLKTGKHVGSDSDTDRADETIGYVVIEEGPGEISGVDFTAATGPLSVEGCDNIPPFNYTLSGAVTGEMAAASQSGMDGGDGGWTIFYGADPIAPTNLALCIDEDQCEDDERAHTTERVGYVVFSSAAGVELEADPGNLDIIEGQSGSFNVRLKQAPTTTVGVTVARVDGDPDISVTSGGTLYFDAGTWSVWQEVTVAAAEDADNDNGTATIECSADNVQPASVICTELDVDYGLPGITNQVPYEDSFEGYDAGHKLIGLEGWYGADPNMLEVLNRNYDYSSAYPLGTTHTNILAKYAGVATNRVESATNDTVWLDMMLSVENIREEEGLPDVDADTKGAVSVNSNGHIAVYHAVPSTGTNRWTVLPDTSVSTGQWLRLTLEMDFETQDPTYGARYYRLHLDGGVLTNEAAYTTNDGTGVAGGAWFAMAALPEYRVTRLEFKGAMMMDDLRLVDVNPLDADSYWRIIASAGLNGSITPSGEVHVPKGDSRSFTITAASHYHIASICTNSEHVSGSPGTNNSFDSTVFTWTNVAADGTIDATFRENIWKEDTPETWLAQYYEGTNDYDAASDSDTDGDGFSAWEEYIAGCCPTNENSRFEITEIGRDGGAIYVKWVSDHVSTGLPPFGVKRKTDILSDDWALIDGNVERAKTNIWWETSPLPPGVPAFYRIVATNAP